MKEFSLLLFQVHKRPTKGIDIDIDISTDTDTGVYVYRDINIDRGIDIVMGPRIYM